MNELTLRQLEYFIAVAETGSVTGAAQRSHVSQAAVSLAITELEKSLGVALTIRRPAKGVALTAEGRTVLPEARAILDQAQQLAERVSQVRQELSGTLHIGCFRTLAMHVIPHLVEWFAEHHPRVELVFDEGNAQEIQEKMMAGQLAACLIYEAQLSAGCQSILIRDHMRRVVVAADHPLAHGDGVSLAELAHYPAVLLDEAPALERTLGEFRMRSLEPNVLLKTRSVQTAQNIIGRGLAYGLLMHVPSHSPEGRPLATQDISDGLPRNAIMLSVPPGQSTTALRALETSLAQLP